MGIPLKQRKFDIFFIAVFSVFIFTSIMSDRVVAISESNGITEDSPSWVIRHNFKYAKDCDPMFLKIPFWYRLVKGLSAFVYMPFYIVLIAAMINGWNWIQVPSIIYGTCITVCKGILIFGVEFFGEEELRCQNPARLLAVNGPYVVIPILLMIRMRKDHPFLRKF